MGSSSATTIAGIVSISKSCSDLLFGRGRENRHHNQTLAPCIANRVDDPGRRKSSVTGGQELLFGADLNYPAALQDDVQLVLPLVRVRSMLLAGLKRVQAREEKIALDYRALAHFVRCEPGKPYDLLCEHAPQFTSRGTGSFHFAR